MWFPKPHVIFWYPKNKVDAIKPDSIIYRGPENVLTHVVVSNTRRLRNWRNPRFTWPWPPAATSINSDVTRLVSDVSDVTVRSETGSDLMTTCQWRMSGYMERWDLSSDQASQVGPELGQMGQIWDFFRSGSVHFGSTSQNVLKLIWKSPRLSLLGPIWPNLDAKFNIPA